MDGTFFCGGAVITPLHLGEAKLVVVRWDATLCYDKDVTHLVAIMLMAMVVTVMLVM